MKRAPAAADSPAAALNLTPAYPLASARYPAALAIISLTEPGGLSFGVLGVGGIVCFYALPTDLCLAQGAFFRRTQKLYQNLCLAQGAIEYRRGSPGIFLSLLFFSV